MKLIVLLVALAGCYAAPSLPGSQLDHPSPINPSVLIESKPRETITLISDANEVAKFKRQTSGLYPTRLPVAQVHHIMKREQTTLNSQQHKRDIPVPLVAKHKHPEESSKINNEDNSKKDGGKDELNPSENQKEERSEQKPNEEVQVEDLSESNTTSKTINTHSSKHVPPRPADNKHEHNHDDAPETSTGHPVIRPKPVPVSELFGRHHDN